jgi:hypothetical protein
MKASSFIEGALYYVWADGNDDCKIIIEHAPARAESSQMPEFLDAEEWDNSEIYTPPIPRGYYKIGSEVEAFVAFKEGQEPYWCHGYVLVATGGGNVIGNEDTKIRPHDAFVTTTDGQTMKRVVVSGKDLWELI